mgnify:CR=1 FL=1
MTADAVVRLRETGKVELGCDDAGRRETPTVGNSRYRRPTRAAGDDREREDETEGPAPRVVATMPWQAASEAPYQSDSVWLTTTRSADEASSVASIPSATRAPISLSESTSFFGQPSVSM